MWWHTALSLISTRWSNGSCTDLRLISAWMKENIYSSTWQRLSFWLLPATPTLQHDFTIQLGSSTNYPISFGQKSWSHFWWPADLQRPHARLLDLAGLHYTTSKIRRPFWSSMLHNFFSRPLSFLDGTTQCSSSWTSIKHNQTSTNDSECSGTTGLQRAQESPCYTLFVSLHWLPVAARIQFKTLMLAYKTTTGSAPTYFHSLYKSTSLPEAPPTSTHYYQSTPPPEAPPTSNHYYESTPPPEAPPTSTHYTNLHPLQKPRLLPLTIPIYTPSRSPPTSTTIRIYTPSRSPAYFHSLLPIYTRG